MGKKSTGDFPYDFEEENKTPFSALPENIKQLEEYLRWEEISKYLLRLLERNENKSGHFSKGGLPWYTRNTWETDDNSSWKHVTAHIAQQSQAGVKGKCEGRRKPITLRMFCLELKCLCQEHVPSEGCSSPALTMRDASREEPALPAALCSSCCTRQTLPVLQQTDSNNFASWMLSHLPDLIGEIRCVEASSKGHRLPRASARVVL
ncbi:hypothetical protein EK904_005501 [Melospiza melodia maxima]|nr:hypothetical protein EK904_005501 [Melospiza melodia maxima]